eukprot:TRINITY_DN582_c0_g2_i1.p1 TRINITY_DN582_c0_g2~~TRINITY_DN582_c0_g2_i1.p1  ORF type:complete len:460 (+),score=23.76 TRINITY_DN582_c0_g2_i1:243-1622(+)
MAMKRFSLGLLAKVLYIWLSCIQPSEAQIVSNSVCKWNTSTSTCQQDQQGLIDLLTEAGEAHTFSLFMRCQYASYKSQCNNLSKDTCIWQNGACHISSKKLVTQINSCFDVPKNKEQKNIINQCKKELHSISNSTTSINYDSVNPVSKCEITKQWFLSTTTTCRLIDSAVRCGGYSPFNRCEFASSRSDQADQFITDLRYVMGEGKSGVSFQFWYLEEELGIRAGNLEGYFHCSGQDLQECEELPPLPSPPPPPRRHLSYSSYWRMQQIDAINRQKQIDSRQKNENNDLGAGAVVGIVLATIVGTILLILVIIFFDPRSRQNCAQLCWEIRNPVTQFRNLQLSQINGTSQNTAQAQNLELSQINVTQVQNRAQNQDTQIETADIIGALPSLEFMGAAENRSEQVCVICLEGLKEGEISTVLPCAHWFHKNCIESWINNKGSSVTCPLCNHPVQQQNNQL